MTILSGQTIMRRAPIANMETRTEVSVGGRRFTYGVGPAGYDLRLDIVEGQALIGRGGPLGDYGWRLDPGQFVLASAVERFQMPDDLLGVVHDKSSWARLGLAVQNTVIEPGWCGFLTLELNNQSDQPIYLPRGVGICQVIFHVLDEPTFHPYGDGKYQNQPRGPQGAL